MQDKQALDSREADLLRQAAAALDEAAEYIGIRIGTYDEQPGEADVERRVEAASLALKLRLAEHVRGCVPDEGGEVS